MAQVRPAAGRVVVELDAAEAGMLEQLAGQAIARLRAESAGGWSPSPALVAVLRSLRDVQIAARATAAASTVHGSAVDTDTDPLASCVSVIETASLLRVSGRRVRQLLAAGQLRARRLPEGAWIVDARSVDERLVATATGRATRPPRPACDALDVP